MTPFCMEIKAVLGEFASLGISTTRAARLLHRQPCFISAYTTKLGVRLPRQRRPRQERVDDRTRAMAALYREGFTLEQIGQQFGVSRERVRQLLTGRLGITRADGGQSALASRRREVIARKRNDRALNLHGCTWEQWQEMRAVGAKMMAEGKGLYTTPLYAFRGQRNNAHHRGIGWELTMWQWWCVWQQSGKWDQRGRGQGYVMCRHGDTGPYAVGNVYIGTAAENSHDGQRNRRKADLPIGVKRTKSGRYRAQRRINGVAMHLGTHDTPELAYAAYLMAGQSEARAA